MSSKGLININRFNRELRISTKDHTPIQNFMSSIGYIDSVKSVKGSQIKLQALKLLFSTVKTSQTFQTSHPTSQNFSRL